MLRYGPRRRRTAIRCCRPRESRFHWEETLEPDVPCRRSELTRWRAILAPAPPEEQSGRQAPMPNARALATKSIGESEFSFRIQTFRAAWIYSWEEGAVLGS